MAPRSATASEMRWRRHPLLSTLVKAVVIVAPAVAAAAVAVAISRALPIPHGAPGTVMWWGVLLVTTFATWLVFASLLQRLLPLATLLDLTLLFPDATPSRFAMLRRSANPRQLQSELRRLRDAAPDAEPGHRAQVILELGAALSIHDSGTRGHSERVRMFTDLVAQQLRLRQSDADRLRWAALLHDIGKLSVAPEILNKPGRPDDEQWQTLHRHPLEGYRLIAPLHEWLGAWAATVRDHHERFDGSGYPNGLKGQAISLGGRIVAVTDSYETMTAARPYKSPMSVRAAREELVRMSESHFDPAIVRALRRPPLSRWSLPDSSGRSARPTCTAFRRPKTRPCRPRPVPTNQAPRRPLLNLRLNPELRPPLARLHRAPVLAPAPPQANHQARLRKRPAIRRASAGERRSRTGLRRIRALSTCGGSTTERPVVRSRKDCPSGARRRPEAATGLNRRRRSGRAIRTNGSAVKSNNVCIAQDLAHQWLEPETRSNCWARMASHPQPTLIVSLDKSRPSGRDRGSYFGAPDELRELPKSVTCSSPACRPGRMAKSGDS